ncbi:hypothetical protein JCM11641_002219 [Rhodosporidiobolus odoratus]
MASETPAPAAADAAPVVQPAATPAAPPPPADSNLIDEEGELSDAFYAVLKTVFLKHAKRPGSGKLSAKELEVLGGSEEAVMGREELNAFAQATNGQDLGDDSYQEIVEYLDVTQNNELTFRGFTQLYSLQTQNDHAETIHDLEAWGYDAKTLKLGKEKEEAGNKVAEEEKE